MYRQYADLLPGVQERRMDIAPLSETEMLRQSHQSQLAWLEQLKYLFPDKYSVVATHALGKNKAGQRSGIILNAKNGIELLRSIIVKIERAPDEGKCTILRDPPWGQEEKTFIAKCMTTGRYLVQ